MLTRSSSLLLETTHPKFVRRLAREIRLRCGCDGFYSGFGCVTTGQRKFTGQVSVRKGRLIAHEVGGCDVDLTGVEFVNSPRFGEVCVSRRLKA